MKKLFLIPLVALFACVNAWGATRTAGTFQELQDAIEAAAAGDVIELTADITWTDHTQSLLINKSISLDGKGKKITGYGDKQETLRIIGVENSQPTVVISNLAIDNKGGIAILIGGYLDSLYIENSTLESSASISGNPRVIEFVGPQTVAARIGIENSVLKTTASGYPIRSYNPMILRMSDSQTSGYCALNLQGNFNTSGTVPPIDGFIGSRGTKFYANNCNFDAPNIHNGKSNGFACFALRDDGIDINLTNCGMNAEVLGNAQQQAFDLSGWWAIKDRLTEVLSPESKHDINITIDGDNSHINGDLIQSWLFVGVVPSENGKYYFMSETGFVDKNGVATAPSYSAENAFQYKANVNFTIKGGTYAIDPSAVHFHGHILLDQLTDEEKDSDPDNYSDDKFESLGISIPSTHEVQTVNQGGTTLYRVVKKVAKDGSGDPLYNLNDYVPVEGEGYGDNPISSFELSDGTNMTLNQEVTTAGYVQIMDGASTPTTVTVAKNADPEHSQTLKINNGLDVQGNSQVVVEATAALVIGEGGITTEKAENIVIEANENGAASLLLHPDITVNQTPELTVHMTAKQVGKVGADYYWHRFAMPVDGITTLPRTPARDTKLFTWNYATEDWASISALTDMQPFYGYTLSTTNDGLEDVVYTFKGHLVGNVNESLNFTSQGYNFFGNSYTGYISVAALVDQLMAHADIDAAIWMWDTNNQTYKVVTLGGLKAAIEGGYVNAMYPKWQQEIAPMQTFILRLPNTTSAATEVDYASAIWGNPRYGNTPASAPARRQAIEGTIIRMAVTADNGMSDDILFMENDNYSDSFEKGFDGTKFMNEDAINMYASVEGENYGAVATDNLAGKTLTIQTTNDVNYTLSFDAVLGEGEYAIRDNVTNQVITIEEGAIYEFAAQPNSVVEGRFEIVSVAEVATAIENTEVKANVKGIYTIMGQYLGENFDILPAGVYVVNGVKIVK